MNNFCSHLVSVCLLGICFVYPRKSNITESENLLNYMFLVYLVILCILQLNSGWNALLFIHI